MDDMFRYRLVHKSESGNITFFFLKNPDGGLKDSFVLTQIDTFTTRLRDSSELHLLFELLSGQKIGDGSFYVENVKTNEKFRIVYDAEKTLSEMANSHFGKERIDTPGYIEEYVVNLLYLFDNNVEVFNYLIQNKMSEDLTDAIKNFQIYRKQEDYDSREEAFKVLCDEMSFYDTIRKLEDGIFEYGQKNNKKIEKPLFKRPK